MHRLSMTTTLTARLPLFVPSTRSDASSLPIDVIVPFADANRSDVPTLGGKGANLGEMTAAGLPIPPGFVISIDGYGQFYEANDLGPKARAELAQVNVDDPVALEASAGALRQLILDGKVPDALHRDRRRIRRARARRKRWRTSCRAVFRDRRGYGAILLCRNVREFLNVSGKAS